MPDDPRESGRLMPGDVLGEWQLLARLGTGGNADVWKARWDDREAALKVLRVTTGEPLERFRAEVTLLRSLKGVAGVLPLVDASAKSDRSVWFAMPVAKPVLKSDNIQSPEVVVAGVAEVAGTLAELHNRGVYHRDLKPSNLFVRDGQWLVGDFGLASFPGKAAITSGAKKLGPVYFIAPEMLNDPKEAAGGPADVYSLAKSLWVLITGQNYPPPGEQRQDVQQMLLETWTEHPRVGLLNWVLEDCTQHSPADRMSMAKLEDALKRWTSP